MNFFIALCQINFHIFVCFSCRESSAFST